MFYVSISFVEISVRRHWSGEQKPSPLREKMNGGVGGRVSLDVPMASAGSRHSRRTSQEMSLTAML